MKKQEPEITINDQPIARITVKKGPLAGKIFLVYRVNGHQVTVSAACQTAVDCNCKDRVYRGRKAGRACKHMRALTALLKGSSAPAQVSPARVVAPVTSAPEKQPVPIVNRIEAMEQAPLTNNRGFSLLKSA